jgi:nucleotide-binding universal stress UspA family protein
MRKILIATDGSKNSLRSFAYLAELYGSTSDLELTLIHIYPAVPHIYLEEQHDPLIRKQFNAWKKKRGEEAGRYIHEASQVLQKSGIKAEQIHAKHGEQVIGVARDIIHEADAGKYDAIVIGKKGLSKIEEFFLGSITNKLVEISWDHPLWVVEGKVGSKKVLLSLDETDHTIELAKFAGKMLQGVDGVEILLYHCCPSLSDQLAEEEIKEMKEIEQRYIERKKERMAQFFDETKKILIDFGIEKKAIDTKFDFKSSVSDKKVSKTLLSEAKKGKFGTIVMGRKGSTKAREFSLGSVSMRTLGEARNCTLWIV